MISLLWSDDFSQSYGPLKFSIVHIVQFLSELFLSNLLREFNETLWEASLPTGDVHIISRLWSDNFSQSYGPLKLSIVHIVQFLFCPKLCPSRRFLLSEYIVQYCDKKKLW